MQRIALEFGFLFEIRRIFEILLLLDNNNNNNNKHPMKKSATTYRTEAFTSNILFAC